jgi:hypothetical protein
MAACVNRNFEQGARVRSIRDFLGGFRGLSSTEKRSSVLDETGLFRAPLDALFPANQVDHAAIAKLLAAMRRHSSPVKPQALGVIGRDHFRRVFETGGADPERFKYCRMLDTDYDGLPFVVEAAFAPAVTVSQLAGVNWSAAIVNPLRSLSAWQGLESVLASARLRLRVSSHGLSTASLERELVIATVSGSTTPVEIRRIAQLARGTNGGEDRRSSAPAAMETILAAHWKTSSRAAMSEDDACTLRANSNALGSQTKYWRLIMQYGKSQEAIDRLTAMQRRVTE